MKPTSQPLMVARLRRFWHCLTKLHRSVTLTAVTGKTTMLACECEHVFWCHSALDSDDIQRVMDTLAEGRPEGKP